MGLRLRLSFIVVAALATSTVLLAGVVSRLVFKSHVDPIQLLRHLGFYSGVTVLFVGLVTYLALTWWVVRPIERLRWMAQSIAKSGDDFDVLLGAPRAVDTQSGLVPDEVRRLAQTFNEMASALRKDRKELQQRIDDLERTTEQLKATQAHLIQSEKLASVGRLSAGVAHEIGNPLAAILGLVELVQKDNLSHEMRADLLQRVHRETQRIHHIIKDLLDFSRQSQHPDANARADIVMTIDEALGVVQPQQHAMHIQWFKIWDAPLGYVQASHNRCVQVFVNLLLNAVDALQGVADAKIQIKGYIHDKIVVVRISDSGKGIDTSDRSKIFEPFFTTKPAGKGTGLGLALSRSIVESMGGTLALLPPSEGLGGACFEIRLHRVA